MTSQPRFPSSPKPMCRLRMHAGGFTMVELLTVIGIIALLTTLTVVGFKHVGGNAQDKETRSRMDRLRNALAEVAGNPKGRAQLNQVLIPGVYSDVTAPANQSLWWDAVHASSSDSLLRTARMISYLAANSSFKSIIDQMPSDQKQTIVFDTTTWQPATNSTPADRKRTVSVPLDAWGNPILFVFDEWQISGQGGLGTRRSRNGVDTGGLSFLYSDSQKTFWKTTQAHPAFDNNSTPFDSDMTSRQATYVRAGEAFRNDADRTSFWFSAGKDGKYQTHDDNLYSFEGN